MKKLLILLLILSFLLVSCNKSDDYIDTSALLSYVDENFSEINGYVDVGEFYFAHNFSELNNVSSVKILVSTESSNFDEIGIFEFKDEKSAKRSLNAISNYVDELVKKFKNGVIYDINQYPKFENATIVRSSNIVIYMILDKNESEPIISLTKK